MPLVTTAEMLTRAREEGYAVGAFNTENMEMCKAIIAAAEAQNAPVIIQTTPGTVKYASLSVFFAMVAALAEKAFVPVAMHLDHGDSIELASNAYRVGYTSIMIDGSHLPFEENIALTRKVVEMCDPGGVPVEGELGTVGGKEDDTISDGGGYTDVGEAKRFVAETGVSSLAVGVGTSHGVYASTPVLNLPLITALRQVLAVPLVLHGASGISDEVVADCIRRGICKVNFCTELRIAYTKAVQAYMAKEPRVFDPKKYGEAGRTAVKALVQDKIRACGCTGKAVLL
jgi:tagatose 1,6-diphosphate aldolase GatY/KbaY